MENVIGIVGLGSMGLGMAQTLLREGFSVYGFDLNDTQKKAANEADVKLVQDIAELCEASQTLLLSLPTAAHVSSVIKGEGGIMEHAQPNSLIIDTTTSEAAVTHELAKELAAQNHQMLDAPVSGGPAGAKAGTMVMVVGGEAEALERARPYLEALSSKIVHLGGSGSGNIAKLINNLLCASHLITTAEAISVGKKAGLDAEMLIEGLNAGSGRSAISEINFPKWILNEAYNSGFTIQLMRKDLRLAAELIEQTGLETPLSSQVTEIWRESADHIPDPEDFNSIVKDILSKG